MKKLLFFAFILIAATNVGAQMPGKMHFGLVYPLSTNGVHAPLDTNNLSIHLISGVSAAERGLVISGFANIIRKTAYGSQFAGFINYAGGNVRGAQFSGFANIAGASLTGVQFAGFANSATNVKGAQFAGFINRAENIDGSQFAGFINIAKTVTSAQMAGFINIADSSDYPVGFINLIKNGEKNIGLTIDETHTLMLSFRSGGKVLYGIIGLGYNFKNTDEVYAMELGFGAHFLNSKYFRINTELAASTLESFKPGEYFKATLRFMPAIRLFNVVEVYGGPTFNFLTTNTDEGKALYTKHLHNWRNKWGPDSHAFYLGYSAGFHFNF